MGTKLGDGVQFHSGYRSVRAADFDSEAQLQSLRGSLRGCFHVRFTTSCKEAGLGCSNRCQRSCGFMRARQVTRVQPSIF